MSAAKNDGGPAFPSLSHSPAQSVAIAGKPESLVHYPERFTSSGGMTLRDWFAGQALMGTCANPSNRGTADAAAAVAYQIADAMLEARK